jgi:hypothetical protein
MPSETVTSSGTLRDIPTTSASVSYEIKPHPVAGQTYVVVAVSPPRR